MKLFKYEIILISIALLMSDVTISLVEFLLEGML